MLLLPLWLLLAGAPDDARPLWNTREEVVRLSTMSERELDTCGGPTVVSVSFEIEAARAARVVVDGEQLAPSTAACVRKVVQRWHFASNTAPRLRTRLMLGAASLASVELDRLGPEAVKAFAGREARIHSCLDQAVARGTVYEAPLRLRWIVQSDGTAAGTRVTSTSGRDPWLRLCTARELARIAFPTRSGDGWMLVSQAISYLPPPLAPVAPGTPTMGSLRKDQIQEVINDHIEGIQKCYEDVLVAMPHLAGRVVVEWQIDRVGRVSDVAIVTSTLGGTAVTDCIAKETASWTFPRPAGNGSVTVIYPYVFNAQ